MTFKEKIDKLLKVNDLKINTIYGLEKYVGASVGSIRKYYELDQEAGLRTIKKIWDKLSINEEWWSTGKGVIFKTKEEISDKKHTSVREPSLRYEAIQKEFGVVLVRVVGIRAQAGYLSGYADPEYMDSLPTIPVSNDFARGGNYLAFDIKGDSMDDGTKRSICHSDTVIAKELQRHHWSNKLHLNKVFIIVHPTDGIVCKQVIAHNTETGEIICHSYNPMYEDYPLFMKDIYQLFYMKTWQRNA